ncbi:MAG: hypothetical protein ACSHXB_19560 [Sulfitobacter sp.]
MDQMSASGSVVKPYAGAAAVLLIESFVNAMIYERGPFGPQLPSLITQFKARKGNKKRPPNR